MPKTPSPKLLALQLWQSHHELIEHYEKRYAAVHGLLDYEADLTLFLIPQLWQARTDTLAELLNAGDWLNWYCWENDMGAKGHEAGVKGKVPTKPCRNVKQLLRIIEADQPE